MEVEEFRELTELAIFKAQPKLNKSPINVVKIDVAGETINEVLFPIFRSDTLISFQVPRSSRQPLGR